MATKIGTLAAIVTANTAQFSEGMKKATGDLNRFVQDAKKIDKNLQQLGRTATDFGKKLSMSVTLPIAALGFTAVKAFDESAKAEGKLSAALQASGQPVKSLMEDYKKFASQIQNVTTIGDDAVIGMLQIATSMGMTGEASKEAVTNAIGLQKAFGLQEEAAIKVAAAVAAGDANMIKRYIPALKGVKDNSEVVAIATDKMRQGFEVAKAEALSGLGPWQQVTNQFGDLQEQFGEIILNAVQPFVKHIKNLIGWFQELSPTTKGWIVALTGIAAAIGPILLGIGGLISILPMLAAGFAAVTAAAPWLLAVGAIVGVVIAIKEVSKATSEIPPGMNKTEAAFRGAGDAAIFFGGGLKRVAEGTKTGSEAISHALGSWKAAKKAQEEDAEAAKKLTTETKVQGAAAQFSADQNFKLSKSFLELQKVSGGGGLKATFMETKLEVVELQDESRSLIDVLKELGEQTPQMISQAWSETVAGIQEGFNKIAQVATQVWGSIEGIFSQSMRNQTIEMEDRFAKEEELLTAEEEKALERAEIEKEKALEKLEFQKLTEEQKAEALAEIEKNFSNKKIDIQKDAADAQKDMADRLAKEKAVLATKTAKMDKAAALMSATVNAAAAVVGALKIDPTGILSILVGILGAAQIGIIQAQPIPQFAEGGIATKPTLGIFGERGPEALIPLDRMETRDEVLRTVITADQIQLILDRRNRKNLF